MSRLQAALLPDGNRLHLQDGPIDLIIQAFAPPDARAQAYAAAAARMETLLDELCAELFFLRAPAPQFPTGAVARAMCRAVAPYAANHFITPMAAVAGAAADEVLAAMLTATPLTRAYVNNGGDIALHLAPGESFTAAVVDRPDLPRLAATLRLDSTQTARGVATSGWRGRSVSLGIADAVTVTAATAAAADAAATIIANAVDLPNHPAIIRLPANVLNPESDLGPRLVTRDVGPLTPPEIAAALANGVKIAENLLAAGLITGAALHLQNEAVVTRDTGRARERALA